MFFDFQVKWNKENFVVDVNNDEDPIVFKAQLFALSGVIPERQKIMSKGVVLKDDEWNVSLKNNAIFLLLGTAEDISAEPIQKTKFVEDMNEEDMAIATEKPAGLTNLGNTCYMNASVQCLKSVPELREALKTFNEEMSLAPAQSITASMKRVFEQMEKNSTVTPILLLQTLHMAFPQFAQSGEDGNYRQQDANECLQELMKMLQQKLPPISGTGNFNSFIDQYFGGTFDVEMRCTETDEEPPTKTNENFLQMSCFISPEVKYMHSGLKLRLKEQLTKRSPKLERDAVYTKTSLINRLPAYLTIQFVRFQYKGREGINAKILKDIKFPIEFDAFELCSPELQQKLTPIREKFKEIEDANVEKAAKVKDQKAGDAKQEKLKSLPYSFEDDLGSNNSGFYHLQAVLTHKGRSSSSGHYVGWARQKGETWVKFDDDVVSQVSEEEILRLSGGGDWHCAYVLIYGPKILQVPEDSSTAEAMDVTTEAASVSH